MDSLNNDCLHSNCLQSNCQLLNLICITANDVRASRMLRWAANEMCYDVRCLGVLMTDHFLQPPVDNNVPHITTHVPQWHVITLATQHQYTTSPDASIKTRINEPLKPCGNMLQKYGKWYQCDEWMERCLAVGSHGQQDLKVRLTYLLTGLWSSSPVVVHNESVLDRTTLVTNGDLHRRTNAAHCAVDD